MRPKFFGGEQEYIEIGTFPLRSLRRRGRPPHARLDESCRPVKYRVELVVTMDADYRRAHVAGVIRRALTSAEMNPVQSGVNRVRIKSVKRARKASAKAPPARDPA